MKVFAAAVLCVLLLAGLLAGLHAYLLDGLDGLFWGFVLSEDTVYSPGYSDSGFRAVRLGMTADEVHRLLGPPQSRWMNRQGPTTLETGERWSFSPGDTNFRCRVVLFRNGIVIERHSEFYLD